ncbi:MAG: hypothetical protein H6620_11260 [Halobacteriovoraceae bacterium]|nr:hypothetical protein [Halobacteriovoraceae bacterium]
MEGADYHRDLVDEYKKLSGRWNANNVKAGILQLVVLGGLFFIGSMSGGFVKPIGGLLAALSLFFMGKDYAIAKHLDQNMVKTLLDGLSLEKSNSGLQRFFHAVLGEISLVRILTTRSISVVLYISILAHQVNTIFFGPVVYTDQMRMILGLIGVVVGSVVCVLYYQTYSVVEEAKRLS